MKEDKPTRLRLVASVGRASRIHLAFGTARNTLCFAPIVDGVTEGVTCSDCHAAYKRLRAAGCAGTNS